MKQILTLTTLLTTILFTAVSCSSDNNNPGEIPPLSEGTWVFHSNTLQTNNADFDERVNYSMKDLTIEQTFDAATKTCLITTKKAGKEPIVNEYIWGTRKDPVTLKDSLYLLNPFIDDDTLRRGEMQLYRKDLYIKYKMTNENIRDFLIENYIDPNILDHYPEITGLNNIQARR